MLPVNKPSFDSNDISFRDFHSLSSIEEILFWDFLIHSSQNGSNIFPNNMGADQLIKHLRETLADVNVWVVYCKHHIVGFWFLEEHENRVIVESYIETDGSTKMFEKFYYGFFKAINSTSTIPLFFNLNHVPLNHKTYFDDKTIMEEGLVNCENIMVETRYAQFSPLVEHIRKFY